MKKLALLLAIAFAANAWAADSNAAATFEKMKTLAGNWEVNWEGKTQPATLSVISAGSALMQNDKTENMVTMFHMDGDRLMLTHYCAAKNQPRLVGRIQPDGSVHFDFLDVTNLPDKNAGHMRRMILTMKDADHFSEQWFFYQDGKESKGETFEYVRKK